MRKLIQFVFLLLIVIITSCRVNKPEQRIYSWGGKEVSKKEYDRLLHKYTLEFVDNYIKKQTP